MPRVWKARYGVSPFADLLVQRMTDHVPPLQPHHVAKYLGVDQAVVSNWLNRGSIPGAPVCSLLAALFHDAPEVWYRAASRQTPQTWADSEPSESMQSMFLELIDLATLMPWSQARQALVIRSLSEMREIMYDRAWSEKSRVSVSEDALAKFDQIYEERKRMVEDAVNAVHDGIGRMQAQGGLQDIGVPKGEAQPAQQDDLRPSRRRRKPRAS